MSNRLAFSDESGDFVQWCLLKGDKVTASECQRLLERMGLELIEAPVGGGPKRGPLDTGELVRVDKTKNTNPLNVDACDKYHDHVGRIYEAKADHVVVQFDNSDRVQFMGVDSGSKTGLYRWTPAEVADKPGRGVLEIVYISDKTAPPPSRDRIEMVQEYVERGLSKGESRFDIYYTGLPLKMAVGQSGFYFAFIPTQRSTPIAGAHIRAVNPAKGHLYYIGVLGHRPGGWQQDLERMTGKAGPGFAHTAEEAPMTLRDRVARLAHEKPHLRAALIPILQRTASECGDGIEAGREHGERGKGYGMTGPDVRGKGDWEPDAKGKCFYETGDEADRCYVTQNGGPGGQTKGEPSTTGGRPDWKKYEEQRWGPGGRKEKD